MEASDEPGGKVFLPDGCLGGCSVRFDRALARPNCAARREWRDPCDTPAVEVIGRECVHGARRGQRQSG
jgi:hypothetical protein